MPSRIARDEFAADAAQKLGIDSALLREELKQAASRRRDSIAAQLTSSPRSSKFCSRPFPLSGPAKSIASSKPATTNIESDFAQMRADVHDSSPSCAAAEQRRPAAVPPESRHRQLLAGVFVSTMGEPLPENVEEAVATIRTDSLEQQQRTFAHLQEAERQGKPRSANLDPSNPRNHRRLRELD